MCMIWYIVVRPPFASNAPIPVPVIKMSLSPVPYLYFQRAPVPYVPSPVPFCLDAVCLSNTFPKCDCYYVQLLNIILSSNQTSISYSTVATRNISLLTSYEHQCWFPLQFTFTLSSYTMYCKLTSNEIHEIVRRL
uniref:Uncharacterized protein n=1 Tax=Cacopsylla melanoneura TaxID=428564 RepID=A0A8D8SQK0_9HEMI